MHRTCSGQREVAGRFTPGTEEVPKTTADTGIVWHDAREQAMPTFMVTFPRTSEWNVAKICSEEKTLRNGVEHGNHRADRSATHHFHWMFDRLGQTVKKTNNRLPFESVLPYKSTESARARERSCKKAFGQGHYYVMVPKVSGVVRSAMHQANKEYPVSAEWVMSLWQQDSHGRSRNGAVHRNQTACAEVSGEPAVPRAGV